MVNLLRFLKFKPSQDYARVPFIQRMVDTTYVIREPVLLNIMPSKYIISPIPPLSSLNILSNYNKKKYQLHPQNQSQQQQQQQHLHQHQYHHKQNQRDHLINKPSTPEEEVSH